MNIRELTENGLAGVMARPIAGRLARKAAEKETEKEIGAVAVPRVKAQAQAIAKTQEKEKPQVATGIIFGRFNPPHKGHKAAWQMASKCAYWYVGTNESTQGPKDPLPYDVKVQAMLTVWPGIKGHLVSEISWLTLASRCFDKHKDSTALICFTDEDWVTKTIQQYNGVKGAHGFYKFDEITQQPTPRLSSATALRTAVQSGDRDAFTKAAGISSETPVAGHPYFDLVAYYLAQFPEKVKKVKETRMSAAVKLQRAWDRERAKSSASHERAQAVLAQARADFEKKQSTEKAKAEFEKEKTVADEGMMSFLTKPLAQKAAEKSTEKTFVSRAGTAGPNPWSPTLPPSIMPPEIKMLINKVQNKVPLRPDEYAKLQSYQAFKNVELKSLKEKQLTKHDEITERFLDNLTNALLDEAKGGTKPIDKEKKAAMKNATTIPGLNMATGSMYMNYRMGIALAGAPDFPTKMEADNWIGGDPLISSYTQEEFEMVKAAAAQVGAGTIQNWTGDRSKEVADVNKASITAKVKRNKYGV